MTSPLKTATRSVATEPAVVRDSSVLPLQEEAAIRSEETTGSLEDAIEQEANLSLMMLDRDSVDQKRERVERMFDTVASLVCQLSPELCKEDHSRFMTLSAKIEQLCLCIEARLVSLERDVSVQEIPDVAWVVRLFRFTDRARKIIHARTERIRRRDADVAGIRTWRELVRTERQRPAKIHDEAVQHVKRLLMYEDKRYQDLKEHLDYISREMKKAENTDYYGKKLKELRETAEPLAQVFKQIEQEFYDKALQKVQESDNGPRPR